MEATACRKKVGIKQTSAWNLLMSSRQLRYITAAKNASVLSGKSASTILGFAWDPVKPEKYSIVIVVHKSKFLRWGMCT